MGTVHWEPLYDAHRDASLDSVAIEPETQRLIPDEDVQEVLADAESRTADTARLGGWC